MATPGPLTAGREGIEQSFDSKLRGVQGWRVTERDGNKREMVTFRDQNVEAQNGLNVVLTIDSVVQHILEAALAEGMEKHSPVSISGIVVRPRTGEILAMATLPTFDPNNPGIAPAGRAAEPRHHRCGGAGIDFQNCGGLRRAE